MKHFTLRFDDEKVHQEFKVKTVMENTSMQAQIMKMIEEWLKEGNKSNTINTK